MITRTISKVVALMLPSIVEEGYKYLKKTFNEPKKRTVKPKTKTVRRSYDIHRFTDEENEYLVTAYKYWMQYKPAMYRTTRTATDFKEFVKYINEYFGTKKHHSTLLKHIQKQLNNT